MPAFLRVLFCAVAGCLTGCSDDHPLHAEVKVDLPAASAADAPPAASSEDAQRYCEIALEEVSVPLNRAVAGSSEMGTAIRVGADRCVLLIGAGDAPQLQPGRRKLVDSAVMFAPASFAATTVLLPEMSQFNDCLPTEHFSLHDRCPAGSAALPSR